ncbi:MAG: hypothetical protein IJ723_00055, partial [Ruminococcus sp.]|nr:hypothetical protein [Ruminococcus sp.]
MNGNITLNCVSLEKLSLAFQQNYIPPVQSIVLKNEGDMPVEGVTVSLEFEPKFAAGFSMRVDRLDPGAPVEISPVKVIVLPDFMFSL